MSSNARIPEEVISKIWKSQNFDKVLFTESGERLEILFCGDENKEVGGPDFINARIKIGNLTYSGDVEIDNLHSDWRNHGHNVNKRFNKIILHVILNNESEYNTVMTSDGRKISTFCVAPYISDEMLAKLRDSVIIEKDNKTNKMHCYKVTSFADDETKIGLLMQLGMARLRRKCDRMIKRFRELLYAEQHCVEEPVFCYHFPQEAYETPLLDEDLQHKHIWEQLFYENLFEALGYSQNKQIFVQLSQSSTLDFIRSLRIPPNVFETHFEAILFSIGGIVPEVVRVKDESAIEYIREIKEHWIKYQQSFTGARFSETQWHFFRMRPTNFPTLRVAAGVRLIKRVLYGDLIGNLIRKFNEINNLNVLKNSVRTMLIVKGEGFWKKHYTFEKSSSEELNYFLGANRADEIFVNIIIPFMLIYFELFQKTNTASKIISLYSQLDCDVDSNLVKEIAEGLQLKSISRRALISQGMIELFRNYCSHEKCDECSIGKLVFTTEQDIS